MNIAQVAFSRNGDVFVADGYCNSRVMQYAADGTFVQQYTHPEVRRRCTLCWPSQR
jgi:NHL repeat